jgi:hypothetical protein
MRLGVPDHKFAAAIPHDGIELLARHPTPQHMEELRQDRDVRAGEQ